MQHLEQGVSTLQGFCHPIPDGQFVCVGTRVAGRTTDLNLDPDGCGLT